MLHAINHFASLHPYWMLTIGAGLGILVVTVMLYFLSTATGDAVARGLNW